MAMLAEVVDAVVGTDTHRDTHELEIAHPSGAVIDTRSISNDTAGYAQAVGWIGEHAPGPRVVVAIEGTRSYGAGLTRALSEAGLTVIECEQPTRKERRRRGKSDAIDAHLAVRWALELDAAKLPTPRGGRRPRSAAHPAVRPGGVDHHRHRTDQPAQGAAA